MTNQTICPICGYPSESDDPEYFSCANCGCEWDENNRTTLTLTRAEVESELSATNSIVKSRDDDNNRTGFAFYSGQSAIWKFLLERFK